MRIPVDPSKVELQGRYNSKTQQNEPPGTTVYHPSWGGQGTGVIEWGMAVEPLPEFGDQEYGGPTRAPHANEAPTVARCARIGYLSSAWYPVRDLTMEPEAEQRKPRPITARPRILTIQQGDNNGEGCIVVVDDPAAIIADGRYGGPPGAPDYDFINSPAGLPGRRYLCVVDAKGAPIPPPRSLDDRFAVFHPELGASFILTAAWATVYRTWDDATEAITTARANGLFR